MAVSIIDIEFVPAAAARSATLAEFRLSVYPPGEWETDDNLIIGFHRRYKDGFGNYHNGEEEYRGHNKNGITYISAGYTYVFTIYKQASDGSLTAIDSKQSDEIPLSTDTIVELGLDSTSIDAGQANSEKNYSGLARQLNNISANYTLGTAFENVRFYVVWGLLTSSNILEGDKPSLPSTTTTVTSEDGTEKTTTTVSYDMPYHTDDYASVMYNKYGDLTDTNRMNCYTILNQYNTQTSISSFDLKNIAPESANNGDYYRLMYMLIPENVWDAEDITPDKATFMCFGDIYKYPFTPEYVDNNSFTISNTEIINGIEKEVEDILITNNNGILTYNRPFNNNVTLTLNNNYDNLYKTIPITKTVKKVVQKLDPETGKPTNDKPVETITNSTVNISEITPNWTEKLYGSFSEVTISVSNKSIPNATDNFQKVLTNNYDKNIKTFNFSLTKDLVNYVSRNRYFNIKFTLTDSTRTNYDTIVSIDKDNNKYYFWRATLPRFSSNVIVVNRNYPITINQLTSNISFNLPTPYDFLTESGGLNLDNFKRIIKGIDIGVPEGMTTNNITLSLEADSVTVDYNSVTGIGTVTFPFSYLQESFKQYNKEIGDYLDFPVTINYVDAFGNAPVSSKMIVRYANTYELNYLRLNFRAYPIMPKYNTNDYKINLSYPRSIGNINIPLVEATNNTLTNLLNPNDELVFTFPAAIDLNESITQYKLKILRKDKPDSFKIGQTNSDYEDLAIINIDEIKESYTYKHIVNNYLTSKFVMLGISAVDSYGYESNVAEFNNYIFVAGRIQNSQFNINSYSLKENELNMTLRINDLGGNTFIGEYDYEDYPNLERNSKSPISLTKKGISIDISYRFEGTTNFTEIKECYYSFEGNNNINWYKGDYKNILNKIVTLSPITITKSTEENKKLYFKIDLNIWYGNDGSKDQIQSTSSQIYTIYPSTATVSYRKNGVGINSSNLNKEVLKISPTGEKDQIVFEGAQTDSGTPQINFDLMKLLISGLIIVDE